MAVGLASEVDADSSRSSCLLFCLIFITVVVVVCILLAYELYHYPHISSGYELSTFVVKYMYTIIYDLPVI